MARWCSAALAALFLLTTAQAQQPAKPMRVLFVGSSYTFYNNLPCLVSELARSRGHAVHTQMIVEGGASLADHLANTVTLAEVAKNWDAVVLQTQSTFGATYLVDGVDRISDTASLLRDARPLGEAIRRGGGRVVFYQHWRRLAAPERDQTAIEHTFQDAASAMRADVIPAGSAWRVAGRTVDPKVLYDGDGSHPSQAGSYLTALAAYATLTGEDPVGLPAELTCKAVDSLSEKVTGEVVTLRIDAALARTLQRAAAESVRDVGRASGVVAPLEPPAMPEGEPVRASDLKGEWEGTTTIYPRSMPWPATLRVQFLEPGAARVTISFGGTPDDVVRNATMEIVGGVLHLSAPRGPNGTVTKYRAVRVGAELAGVVEFTGSTQIYGAGRWQARRKP